MNQAPDAPALTRISAQKLAGLKTRIEGKKNAKKRDILYLLDDFHYATGSQIQRLFFTDGSDIANTRARNRALTSLSDEKLLHRYPRRRLELDNDLSTEYIYTLDRAGQKIMNNLRGVSRPFRSVNRSMRHYLHALEVTKLHVQLTELDAKGTIKLIGSTAEPASHRRIRRHIVKPDYYAQLRRYAPDNRVFEEEWFIEVERSRQGDTPTLHKIRAYTQYRKLIDPDKQYMPRVLFICYDTAHRRYLDGLFDRNAGQDGDVFMTALQDEAIEVITNGGKHEQQ